MPPTILAVLGWLLALAALGLLVGAILAFVRQRRKFAGRVTAAGTVVELHHRIVTSGRSGIFCPVVEFQAPSGATVRFESDFGSQPANHTVGQVVKVLYNPADPQQAEINSGFSRLLVPGFLLVMGLILLCLSAFFTVLYMLILSS